MAENKVDEITIEIEATTDKADKGIDKTIEALKSMQVALNGINTKNLKQGMESFEDFQKKLQGLGKNVNTSGSYAELKKQVAQVETKLDSLLRKENKIKTVSGVNENSKQYRNLQYDIAEVCGQLDTLYAKMEAISSKKVLNFWEKPNWEENLKKYGTTDEKVISEQWEIKGIDDQKVESLKSTTDQLKESFSDVAQQVSRATNSMQGMVFEMERAENEEAKIESSFARLKSVFSEKGNISTLNSDIQNLVDGIQQARYTIKQMESGNVDFDAERYKKAVSGLRKAQEEFQNFKASINDTPKTMDDVARSISSIGDAARKCGLDTFSTVLQGVAAVLPSIEIGGMAANAGFQSMATGLQAVQAAIPVIGLVLTLVSALVNAVNAASNKIKNAVGKIATGFKSMVNHVRQSIAKMLAKLNEFSKKIKSFFGIQDKSLSDFQKKIKSFTRLFTFMLLRKLITQLFEGAREGFESLAKYSNHYATEFNKNVSRIYSDLKQLGNAFATAFEPILNYVTPILDFLINKLIEASNALAQFFAALTGKSTWTKAIRLNENYAESLEGAAKVANNLTAGIDELNILQKNSSGGVGTSPQDAFTTESVGAQYKNFADMIKDAWNNADFYDVGKMLGDKLAESLANIPWNVIRANARKLGKSLATLINGLIEGEFDGKSVSWWIGNTLAQAVNTAFDFINDFAKNLNWSGVGQTIMDGVRGFCEGLDWENAIRPAVHNLALGIADLFNAVFGDTETWALAGTTLCKAINTLIDGVLTFVNNFSFKDFGTSIGTFLRNALHDIDYPGIGHIFSGGVNGIFESVLNFARMVPWIELASNISSGINNAISGIKWNTIYKSVRTFFSGLGSHIMTYIREIDWGSVAETLVNGVTTIFVALGSFLSSLDPTEIGQAIAKFVNKGFAKLRENKDQILGAINSLIHTLSEIFLTALSEIDWQEVFGTIHEYLSGIDWKTIFKTAIVGIAAVFTFKNLFQKIAILDIGLQLVAGIIEGIGEAIKNIGKILKEVLVDPIVNWVKKLFGIHSPSTVFAEIGGYLVEGLILGITNFWGKCKETISKWAQNVRDWFYGTKETLKDKFSEFGNNIVEGFREKVGSTYITVKGKIDAWASGVKEWFHNAGGINGETWTQYADEIFSGFREKVGNTYTTVKENILAWATGVKEWFYGTGTTLKDTFMEYAGNIISGFKEKVGNTYTTVKENMNKWSTGVKEWFYGTGTTLKDKFTEYAGNIITGFKDKVGNTYGTVKSNISTWAEGVKEWFNKSGGINEKTWTTYATEIVSGFKSKIGSTYTDSKSALEQWANGVKDWFTDIAGESSFGDLARNVVYGFRNGIGNFYNDCRSTIEGWAYSISGWFRNSLGIHSPSKLFEQFGNFTVLGFNNAIESTGQSTKGIVSDWISSFTDNDINFGMKMRVNDSALKDYQNNYGSDFTNDAIIQRVQREVTNQGTVQAALNVGGGFSETLRNVVREEISPIISDMAADMKRQANKSEQVIIGGRTITDVVRTQQKAEGYRFAT